MGRLKKPTNLKILQGNPGKRPLNTGEPTPLVAIPDPFTQLDPDAMEAWRKLAPMLLKNRILTEADSMAFTILCHLWSDYMRARRVEASIEGDRDKILSDSPKSGAVYQNPIRGNINTLIQLLDKLMSRFGLTPTSRANVKADLEGEENPFAQFGAK